MCIATIELTFELVGLLGTFVTIGVVYGVLKAKIKSMEDKQSELAKKADSAARGWQENHDKALVLEQAASASCAWHEGWERRCQMFREDCMAIRRAEHDEFKLTSSELFKGIDKIKDDISAIRADLRVMANEMKKNGNGGKNA